MEEGILVGILCNKFSTLLSCQHCLRKDRNRIFFFLFYLIYWMRAWLEQTNNTFFCPAEAMNEKKNLKLLIWIWHFSEILFCLNFSFLGIKLLTLLVFFFFLYTFLFNDCGLKLNRKIIAVFILFFLRIFSNLFLKF